MAEDYRMYRRPNRYIWWMQRNQEMNKKSLEEEEDQYNSEYPYFGSYSMPVPLGADSVECIDSAPVDEYGNMMLMEDKEELSSEETSILESAAKSLSNGEKLLESIRPTKKKVVTESEDTSAQLDYNLNSITDFIETLLFYLSDYNEITKNGNTGNTVLDDLSFYLTLYSDTLDKSRALSIDLYDSVNDILADDTEHTNRVYRDVKLSNSKNIKRKLNLKQDGLLSKEDVDKLVDKFEDICEDAKTMEEQVYTEVLPVSADKEDTQKDHKGFLEKLSHIKNSVVNTLFKIGEHTTDTVKESFEFYVKDSLNEVETYVQDEDSLLKEENLSFDIKKHVGEDFYSWGKKGLWSGDKYVVVDVLPLERDEDGDFIKYHGNEIVIDMDAFNPSKSVVMNNDDKYEIYAYKYQGNIYLAADYDLNCVWVLQKQKPTEEVA